MPRYLTVDHPGLLLKEDFLADMGIKPATLARAIGVTRSTVSKILAGERDITADMSIRLGKFLGLHDGYWLTIQRNYDLIQARQNRSAVQIKPYSALSATECTTTQSPLA
jgi:addiction module HigA family antidote